MFRRVSSARAKAQFADYLRAAERGDPILITRHGKPVAALVAAADLQQVERLRAAGPEKGLAGLAGGWKGSDQLVRAVKRDRRTRARRAVRFD